MEAPPHIPDISFLELIVDAGPILAFGWWSLLILIIMGCVLLLVPPRSSRRMSLVDLFAACFHVQILVFMLCVPLLLIFGTYISGGSPRVYVRDMLMAGSCLLIDLTIGGALLLLVSLRHRKTPSIEWRPVISVVTSMFAVAAGWQCKIAASVWFWAE